MAAGVGLLFNIALPGHAMLGEETASIARGEETVVSSGVEDATFICGSGKMVFDYITPDLVFLTLGQGGQYFVKCHGSDCAGCDSGLPR